MAQTDENIDEADAPLGDWRQGDFALRVGGFLFAAVSDNSTEAFDAEESDEGIVGLVVISQSCDIVRRTSGRHYVAVCPLVRRNEDEISQIRKGRRPYLVDVENTEADVFSDLRRVMSVSKDLLRTWVRHEGFQSEETRIRFALALERKFGQFAFPDEFDTTVKNFKERVWRRHDSEDSPPGKVYRSLAQIRFRAAPDWRAEKKQITVLAILVKPNKREDSQDKITSELEEQLNKVKWPPGYEWTEPKFVLADASYFSAEDILTSQRADFDFLCA